MIIFLKMNKAKLKTVKPAVAEKFIVNKAIINNIDILEFSKWIERYILSE